MSDRNTPDDGGQAFPSGLCPDDKGDTHAMHLGMTLRDYFAAKAIVGLIVLNEERTVQRDAEIAYVYADAMLAARKATGGGQ